VQIKDKHLTLVCSLIYIWLWLLLPFNGVAQLSTRHYVPPIPGQYYQGDVFYNSSYLYISTPYPEARFTIKPIGQLANNWITGVVTNTDSFKVEVSNDEVGADPSGFENDFTFTDKGFEVVADRGVYVSLRIKANNHAGALVSKGIDGFGKDFRVGGMERQGSYDFSFFSLIATQNNTLVEFFSPVDQLEVLNVDGTLPNSIVLNKNESYIALFNGVDCGRFIGTRIVSQNDIVVNTGSIQGSFSNEIIDSPDFFEGEEDGYPEGRGERDLGHLNGSDIGFDQLVSLDASVDATNYLLIKGDSFNSIENALVIATENGTTINLNGDSKSSIELDAGDNVFVEGNQFFKNTDSSVEFLNITSNKNIYVFQGTGKKGNLTRTRSNGEKVHFYGANQGMFFVPPLSCTSVGDVESIARIDEVDYDSNFSGSLFILSTYGSAVEVNGQSVSSLQGLVYDYGPIQSSASEYQVQRIDGLEGDVSIVGSEELYVSYYNVNNTATSGAFYSGFNLEPKVYPDLALSSLGSCVDLSGGSNVALRVPYANNYDSLKWQKENKGGTWDYVFSGSSSDDPEYIPDDFGSYRVEVIIDCLAPNNIVYSAAVNVSVCPNDTDQDGVVDNIDLDSDNDGVYDSLESFGDFLIDLTKNPPELMVSNPLPYSAPLFSQTLSVANGAFTPLDSGRFTSFLPPKQNSDDAIRYQLNPVVSKSIHFLVRFDNSESVIPDQENSYYILESIDPSESITLLDPESELEILENSSFISGYSFYNNSKITFRFSENAVGKTSKFVFQVNNSSGLVFTHHNDSSEDSMFNGVFGIRNLDRFSDNDLSSDKYDLDSDDDGCFDVVEAGFLDPDSDGKLGQSPLTIDDNTVSNRGAVINHPYALTRDGPRPYDRDYNGIFDFQEQGSPAEVSASGHPVSVEVCDGEVAVFTVDTPTTDAVFQWVIDGAAIVDNSTFSGTNTNSLTVTTDYGLNGSEVQVLLSRPTYACPVESIGGVILTVTQIPETPTLEPIYTYCNSDIPTIEDLKNDIGGSVGVFLSSSGGSALGDDVLLVHDQTYHVEAYSPAGCVSLTRAETDAFISNPKLLSSEPEICMGESVTLTVNGVPQTAQDFANANPDFVRFLQYESSSYFLKRESMAWTDAYNLIQSLGAGASMYVINSKDEEDVVYDALNSLGVAGTSEIHFWLGLRQLSSLNPNNEIDKGWQWLDGRLLTNDLANWTSDEPNDCCDSYEVEDGEEDYGQFDFNAIKSWNDMKDESSGNGDSWPIFEFTGTTEVVWGKIDPQSGLDVVFDGIQTSSIVRSPTETTTYFYEVTTNSVICRVETTVVVNPLPVILPANDMELCDNGFDGDAFNGLVNSFDLQAQELLIQNGDSSVEVLFFLNETDANAIDKSVLFGNSSNPQKLYYRLKNKNTGCDSNQNGSFTLRVLPVPPTIEIEPHYECDDQASGSDTDNITSFNLQLNDSRIQTLLGGSAGQYSISYHTTLSGAENPSVQGITSYTMTASDNRNKTIYVRVTNNLTSLSCFTASNLFDLVLTPLPVISQSVVTFEQCDETDGVSDGIVRTNLRSFENVISTNSSNEKFTYYKSPTRSPESKISDPTSYYNSDINGSSPIPNDVVYVQINSVLPNNVFAPNGSCVRNAEIRINVAVSQIKESFMIDFYACELAPSTTQDGRTLFPPTVFDTLTTGLLNQHPLFSVSGVVIKYYPTLEDATLKKNEIDQNANYENPNPVPNGVNWVDEVWANVEVVGLNTIKCVGLKKVANLHVESLPTAHAVAPFRACDDDDDGLFTFDTTRAFQELTQGQADIKVFYFDSNYNLLFTGALPDSYKTGSQKIIARVENDPSNNNPPCYEETEIEFIVDDTPSFNPIPTQVLCDDSDGMIDGVATFNTQFIEREVLNGQTNVAVYYFDDQGNALPSPLPPLFSTPSASIRVKLVNTINASCVDYGFVDFNVIENPSFSVNEQAVLCLNEVVLDLEVKSPSENYSYVWEYVDENNAITRVGDSSKITISVGGTYKVTATTVGDIGCSTTKTVEVIASELAKFDANDIIISGFSSQQNTVEIITGSIGVGDYEYALDDSGFQDSPYFEQVRPGLRTVYVRDRLGCGVSSVQVGVVGYYKYFSPNNDGINDTWQILGLKTAFNSLSSVYIYDRYGRFLTQISGPDESWDGSYQGRPVPADDYWFRLELQDGRVYTGHFSLMR